MLIVARRQKKMKEKREKKKDDKTRCLINTLYKFIGFSKANAEVPDYPSGLH